MRFTRRQALAAIAGSAALRAQDAKPAPTANLPMAVGKFKPDDESFKQYQYPDWFRDAKFGMWAHWGPQAVPRQGDWYAKKMYLHDTATPLNSATRTSFRSGKRRSGIPSNSWASTKRPARSTS